MNKHERIVAYWAGVRRECETILYIIIIATYTILTCLAHAHTMNIRESFDRVVVVLVEETYGAAS